MANIILWFWPGYWFVGFRSVSDQLVSGHHRFLQHSPRMLVFLVFVRYWINWFRVIIAFYSIVPGYSGSFPLGYWIKTLHLKVISFPSFATQRCVGISCWKIVRMPFCCRTEDTNPVEIVRANGCCFPKNLQRVMQ